jgi:signal transduction histidine kinase/CheY-like chemotaxis protein
VLDERLRRRGDTRDERLRKTAVFFLACFCTVAMIAYISIAGSQGILKTVISWVFLNLILVLSVLVVVALLVTRNVLWATIYGHVLAVTFSILFPLSVVFGPGIGVIDENGEPKLYQFVTLLAISPVVAFMFRSKTTMVIYTSIAYLIMLVTSLANFRGDDKTGTEVYFAIVSILMLVQLFSLVFFSDVASSLEIESVVAKGREKKAQKQATAERRANEAKTRFVSVMSHEIRNPLQAILLQLEMLETTSMTVTQADYVSGITRASNVLLTIVNDILDVTKIESGAIALESIPMSLRDVVEFTLHTNAPKASKQGVELICFIDPKLNTAVLGDPTRIRQVLHNFVGNALKFTESGEVEVTLDLLDDNVQWAVDEGAVETTGDADAGDAPKLPRRLRWKLNVRDTGIGIDEAGKQKLFQEFSQVDETTTRMYGGTGLGLFICKELSEIMGGGVSVESEPGVGSTFSATFLVEESTAVDDVPVHVVSSTCEWTLVVYATNAALTRTVDAYASFFLSGVASVNKVLLDRPKAAEQRIKQLVRDSTPTKRSLILVNHADCTSSLTRLLTGINNSNAVPVVLAEDPAATLRKELESEGWPSVVHKPLSLRQLCSTLDRAIGSKGKPGAAQTVEPIFSDEDRMMGDGTLTRGTRVPTVAEMDAASAAQAASRPDAPTVLIVDDFELVRSLVQRVVAQLGYNTLVAANGREAVATVRANYDKIAMVLMDCEMPIMDGYTATEAIRKYEAERGVPQSAELYVCAMTANAMREDVKKCYSRRMSGFLAKPVKRADVDNELREHALLPSERGPATAKKPRRRRKSVGGDDSSSSSSSHRSLRGAMSPPRITITSPSPQRSTSRRKKRAPAGVDADRSQSLEERRKHSR